MSRLSQADIDLLTRVPARAVFFEAVLTGDQREWNALRARWPIGWRTMAQDRLCELAERELAKRRSRRQ